LLSKQVFKPLIIIGGGGHASVLVDILLSQGREVLAVISTDDISQRAIFIGIKHFKKDYDILAFNPDEVLLVNGLGMLPKSNVKYELNEWFLSLGYHFETVVAESALVSPFAKLGEGTQVFSGAIVQAGAILGEHSVINSGAIVEHDCIIGRYNHIAPRATLCGQVVTEDRVYIGAGATIVHNIRIGDSSVVGAGTIVTKNLSKNILTFNKHYQVKKVIK
jgi:sugar O-acyltransferase (sialic acid O-acetyltransferase NeuD family)